MSCRGRCFSTWRYHADGAAVVDHCTCCQAVSRSRRPVKVLCFEGGRAVIKTKQVGIIRECVCGRCPAPEGFGNASDISTNGSVVAYNITLGNYSFVRTSGNSHVARSFSMRSSVKGIRIGHNESLYTRPASTQNADNGFGRTTAATDDTLANPIGSKTTNVPPTSREPTNGTDNGSLD